MDNKLINELNNSVNKLNNNILKLNNTISNFSGFYSRNIGEEFKKANRNLASSVRDFTENTKKTKEEIKEFGKEVKNLKGSIREVRDNTREFGKELEQGSRIFSTKLSRFGNEIDSEGKTISRSMGKTAEGIFRAGSRFDRAFEFVTSGLVQKIKVGFGSAILGSIIGYYVDTAKAMRETLQSGIDLGGDIRDFGIIINRAGLRVDQFAEMTRRGAMSIRALGQIRFVELNKQVRESLLQFANFGMTQDQVNEFMVEYLETQRRIGLTNVLTQEELRDNVTRLAGSINYFSRVTGRSAEQIRREREAIQSREATISLGAAAMTRGEDFRRRFAQTQNELMTLITNIFGPELGKKMVDSIAPGILTGTTEAVLSSPQMQEIRQTFMLMGESGARVFDEFLEKVVSPLVKGGDLGGRSVEDIGKTLMQIMRESRPETSTTALMVYAQARGMQIPLLNNLLEAYNKVIESRGYDVQEMQKQRLQITDETRTMLTVSQRFSEAQMKLVGDIMDLMRDKVGLVTNALEGFLSSIEKGGPTITNFVQSLDTLGKNIVAIGGLLLGVATSFLGMGIAGAASSVGRKLGNLFRRGEKSSDFGRETRRSTRGGSNQKDFGKELRRGFLGRLLRSRVAKISALGLGLFGLSSFLFGNESRAEINLDEEENDENQINQTIESFPGIEDNLAFIASAANILNIGRQIQTPTLPSSSPPTSTSQSTSAARSTPRASVPSINIQSAQSASSQNLARNLFMTILKRRAITTAASVAAGTALGPIGQITALALNFGLLGKDIYDYYKQKNNQQTSQQQNISQDQSQIQQPEIIQPQIQQSEIIQSQIQQPEIIQPQIQQSQIIQSQIQQSETLQRNLIDTLSLETRETFNKISSSYSQLGEHIKTFLENSKKTIENIKTNIIVSYDSLTSKIENYFSSALSSVVEIYDSINARITTTYNRVSSSVSSSIDYLSGLYNDVKSSIEKSISLKEVTEKAINYYNLTTSFINSLTSDISKNVDYYMNSMNNFVRDAFNKITSIDVSKTLNSISENIKDIFRGFDSFFADTYTLMTSNLSVILPDIKEIATGTSRWISDQVDSVYESLTQRLQRLDILNIFRRNNQNTQNVQNTQNTQNIENERQRRNAVQPVTLSSIATEVPVMASNMSSMQLQYLGHFQRTENIMNDFLKAMEVNASILREIRDLIDRRKL